MTLPTHIAFSNLTFLFVASLFDHIVSPNELIALSIGSILPDIDTPNSTIGRLVYPLSCFLNKKFSHRGAVHSLLFSIPFILIPKYGFFIFFGFISHLILDMMTKSGVMFFYPIKLVAVIPKKDEWRIATKSTVEWILLTIFLILTIPSYRLNTKTIRYFIHSIIKNVRSVADDFSYLSDENDVYVSIKGSFTFSNEKADGIYKIISRLDERTILVEKDGNLYSVGTRKDNEINPRKVWIEKVKKVNWKIVKIDLTGFSADDISNLPGRMYGKATLLYPVHVDDTMIHYPSIQGYGKNIRIIWAKGKDFESLGKNVFISGSVILKYEEGQKNIKIPHYSFVREYDMNLLFGDMVLVSEGMKLKRGDVIVLRRYRRKKLEQILEEKRNELSKLLDLPRLETIKDEDMSMYMVKLEEKRKKIIREIERITNDILELQDLTAVKDGVVKIIDWNDGKIIISEF